MVGEEIYPHYSVFCGKDDFGIFGKEDSSGETVFIQKVSQEAKTAFRLAKILNENKVSVHHAKDVLKDLLLEPLL